MLTHVIYQQLIFVRYIGNATFVFFMLTNVGSRGYMTANGQPDGSRAARVILKHYVNGRLLFCIAPPEVDQKKFHSFPPPEENRATKTFTPFENILLKVHYFF